MTKLLLSLFLLAMFIIAGVFVSLVMTGTGAVRGSFEKFFTILLIFVPVITGIIVSIVYKNHGDHLYIWLLLPIVYGLIWFLFIFKH